MAALTVQKINTAGVVITTTAAGGSGDTAPCGDTTWLEVTNGSGSSINVTLTATSEDDLGRTDAPVVVAVAASAVKRIGPLSREVFANKTDRLCHIAYSLATSVTVAVVEV